MGDVEVGKLKSSYSLEYAYFQLFTVLGVNYCFMMASKDLISSLTVILFQVMQIKTKIMITKVGELD